MITYVTLYVAADGEKASEVTRRLKELGFETTLGNHDFAFRWKDRDVTPDVVELLDRIVPIEDADVSKELLRSFKKQGIRCETGIRYVCGSHGIPHAAHTCMSAPLDEPIITAG